MEGSDKANLYQKIDIYIGACSVVITIIAAVIYVSVSLAKMDAKIEIMERLKSVEVKVEKLEEKK